MSIVVKIKCNHVCNALNTVGSASYKTIVGHHLVILGVVVCVSVPGTLATLLGARCFWNFSTLSWLAMT